MWVELFLHLRMNRVVSELLKSHHRSPLQPANLIPVSVFRASSEHPLGFFLPTHLLHPLLLSHRREGKPEMTSLVRIHFRTSYF